MAGFAGGSTLSRMTLAAVLVRSALPSLIFGSQENGMNILTVNLVLSTLVFWLAAHLMGVVEIAV
jgi:hypothetical protein